jgi:hypothetical protein
MRAVVLHLREFISSTRQRDGRRKQGGLIHVGARAEQHMPQFFDRVDAFRRSFNK